ncbi:MULTISPECIES: transposase [unclassified Streptomyces]|nr:MULTISPECIES: transposase [unclassified Streptomyces]
MTLSARTGTRQAVCPGCGTAPGRVHGGYRRRLADMAVAGDRCPELEQVATCLSTFADMMTERRGQDLADWLERAEAANFPSLTSLARGLRHDFQAVTAGLTLEWNSGRVEGNVNRVKRIKRDGYSRAGFDLLRLQILHAD